MEIEYKKIPSDWRFDFSKFEPTEDTHKHATRSKMRPIREIDLPGYEDELIIRYRNVSSFQLGDLREEIENQLKAQGYYPEVPAEEVEAGGEVVKLENPDHPDYQVALQQYENAVANLVSTNTAGFLFQRGILGIEPSPTAVEFEKFNWKDEVTYYREENPVFEDVALLSDVMVFFVYVCGMSASQIENLAVKMMSTRSIEQVRESFRGQTDVQRNGDGTERLAEKPETGVDDVD